MRKHFKYLSYLIRHKWFVLVAGIRIKAPLLRLLSHDWTKFLPSEWFAYVDYFYDPEKKDRRTTEAFRRFGVCEAAPYPFFVEDYFHIAWFKHQKRNKHHWQYWVWFHDTGQQSIAKIPDKYLREMVADWAGAGRAITGNWDLAEWYAKNATRIQLHFDNRPEVERLVECFRA